MADPEDAEIIDLVVVDEERKKPPRWRRRKDARPQELVKAALELFAEQGYARTRLRDVAKHAGVSKGTVYLYFKSKEDLLMAAVRESVVPILDSGEQIELEAEGTSSELLVRLATEWVEQFDQRGVDGVPKLVMSEASHFPELGKLYVECVLERGRRLFKRVLKRGVQNGEFHPVDLDEAVDVLMAPIAYGQIHRHSLAPYDQEGRGMSSFLQTHLTFFLRAISAKTPE